MDAADELRQELIEQMELDGVREGIAEHQSRHEINHPGEVYTVHHFRVGPRYGIADVPFFDAFGGGWFILDYQDKRVVTAQKVGRLWEAVSYLMDLLTQKAAPSDWPDHDTAEYAMLFEQASTL